MEKITREQIKNALLNNQSFEVEADGCYYYIHIQDGKIVPTCDEADESFTAKSGYEIADEAYEHETDDDEDFNRVIDELLNDVNAYVDDVNAWAENFGKMMEAV